MQGIPHVEFDWLAGTGSSRLIALSCSIHGEVGQLLQEGQVEKARQRAQMWAECFPRRFYLEIARTMGIEDGVRKALHEQVAIASVGPIMNAALAEHGFEPDIVPVHPKMGVLVQEAAARMENVVKGAR